ncbi:hypothetical protein KHQ81_11520 [Mycoplasmatota bacterium]|nr:hypothetical protein KHQ81_11520 [Mycoplasmatota bacterium]
MSKVYVKKSYYASLCYYGLKQLGFIGGKVNEKYQHEAEKLEKFGTEFAFCAPAAGGPIFTLVYQIPSYLNPNSVDKLIKIQEAINHFVCSQSIEVFKNSWPSETKYWDDWYNSSWMTYLFKSISRNPKKVIKVVDYFFKFINKLWPIYQDIYRSKIINYDLLSWENDCKQVQVFKKWNEELGINYPYDEFNLIICPENPTTASSLGPQQIVFGDKYKWSMMKNTLVHEVGVRYLGLKTLSEHPLTSNIMKNDYFSMIKLIETEVCYRKPRLIPNLLEDPFVKGMQLENLLIWRRTQKEYKSLIESFAHWYHLAKIKRLL